MFKLVLKENNQLSNISVGDIYKFQYKDADKVAYILVLAETGDEDLGKSWYTLAVNYFGDIPRIVNERSRISEMGLKSRADSFKKLNLSELDKQEKEKIESTILNRENIVNKLNSLLSTENIDEEQMENALKVLVANV